MKWSVAIMVLLLAATLSAQTQKNQSKSLSNNTAIPSEGQHKPALSNSEVRYQIQSRFDTDLEFNNMRVWANVNSNRVTLGGSVHTEGQLQRAAEIAQQFADGRTVVNNITIGGPAREWERDMY